MLLILVLGVLGLGRTIRLGGFRTGLGGAGILGDLAALNVLAVAVVRTLGAARTAAFLTLLGVTGLLLLTDLVQQFLLKLRGLLQGLNDDLDPAGHVAAGTQLHLEFTELLDGLVE